METGTRNSSSLAQNGQKQGYIQKGRKNSAREAWISSSRSPPQRYWKLIKIQAGVIASGRTAKNSNPLISSLEVGLSAKTLMRSNQMTTNQKKWLLMRQAASNQWPIRTRKKRKALRMSQWLMGGWKTSPLCWNKRGYCRSSTKDIRISLRWGWLAKFLHLDPHQDRRQDIPPSWIGLANSKIYRTQSSTTGRTL